MMVTTWDLVLVLHILGAVVWVGGMFFALAVLRPSLGVLEPVQRLALHLQVFRRFFLVVWHAMPIVLISGYAMLFGVFGGFPGAPWNVHVMHLLGLIMAVVFIVLFFGPWRVLRAQPGPAGVDRIRTLVTVNLVLGFCTILVAALGHYG
jgi:uncharacterized membrane protein